MPNDRVRKDVADTSKQDKQIRQLTHWRTYMPVIAALTVTPDQESYIRSAFGNRASLRIATEEVALKEIVRGMPIDALIVPLRTPSGRSLIALVEELHHDLAHVQLIAYVDIGRSTGRDLLEAGRRGISLALFRDEKDPTAVVDAVVATVYRSTLLAELRDCLDAIPSEYVRRFCHYCLSHASQRMSLEQIAARMRVSRQHLARQFAASEFRSPSWFIGIARVLMAIKMVEDHRQPIEQVAAILNFPSSSALRKAIRRYTGMTATELRCCGGSAHIRDIFRAALVPQPLSPEPRMFREGPASFQE